MIFIRSKKHFNISKLGLLYIPLLFLAISFKPEIPPNVVLVYFDDMGYGDISVTGAIDYQTPNFDKLAHEGVFFSQFYSPQAVCSASRAGLLTGCYPNRIGFSGALDHTAKIGLNPEETTIAEALKTKGYATAAIGKWHLGHLDQFLPTRHGFDQFFGIPYSHDMGPGHPSSKNYYPELPLYENEKIIERNPDFSQFTKTFTQKALDFIKANKRKPFFLYLAHPMPHVPLAASEAFIGKSKHGLYGDVIMELDWSIGQIRDFLQKNNLSENTLLIVTSDNGPWFNYGNHAGSAGGLREGKGTTFDGGQKVPAMMAWKGSLPEGKILNGLASGIDILPTICEATGAHLPDRQIDGISLLSYLKGKTESPREMFLYYYRKNSLEAIRFQNWKLVFDHPGRTYEGFEPGKDGQPGKVNENFSHKSGLYDLRRDPGERYDVSAYFPEIIEKLNSLADQARVELGDDLKNTKGKNNREIGKTKESNK